jgi:hypothetical protein
MINQDSSDKLGLVKSGLQRMRSNGQAFQILSSFLRLQKR